MADTATSHDELTYLRIMRNRACLARLSMRRLLADHEADYRDVIVVVAVLHNQAAQLSDDTYDRAPEPS